MPKGRATSDEQKVAAGTYKPSRARPLPKLAAKAPMMPRSLSKDGKRVWKSIVPEMAHAKMLTALDVHVLFAFCELMGEFYQNPKGFKKGDVGHLRQLMCELGLTPASRLRTPPLEEVDPEWLPKDPVKAPSGGPAQVVSISSVLRNTPWGSQPGPSKPGTTSGAPVNDS